MLRIKPTILIYQMLLAHYLTNRFHAAVCLFSNRSQMTSKCGKNKKVAHEAPPSVSLMLLPNFYVFCDLLLNRRTATWNLFVLYYKEAKVVNGDVMYESVLQWIISNNQSKCMQNSAYFINTKSPKLVSILQNSK